MKKLTVLMSSLSLFAVSAFAVDLRSEFVIGADTGAIYMYEDSTVDFVDRDVSYFEVPLMLKYGVKTYFNEKILFSNYLTTGYSTSFAGNVNAVTPAGETDNDYTHSAMHLGYDTALMYGVSEGLFLGVGSTHTTTMVNDETASAFNSLGNYYSNTFFYLGSEYELSEDFALQASLGYTLTNLLDSDVDFGDKAQGSGIKVGFTYSLF